MARIWLWLSLAYIFMTKTVFTKAPWEADKLKKPNIIFILADDLGFNDVPWHNSDVVAPNLKSLADSGVILEQSYVLPVCSPTRSALLSGRYPFTIGRQRGVIWPMMPTGLTLKSKIIPEYLKPLGYSTHAIGKWHLGYCNWKYTPTERGFDTFRGYYNGAEDYYTKMRSYSHRYLLEPDWSQNLDHKPEYNGIDYRNNRDVYYNASNVYSTYDYAKRFESVVQSHGNLTNPIFIYMAFQSVHAPLQVPEKYTKPYSYIKDQKRRTYLGMVSAMDEAIGRMVNALKKFQLYDNSVIIFSTDNGGPTSVGGNNWPLRGNKTTLWEGGTRGAAFVHSPLLPKKGIKSYQLIHTTDWLPTIVNLAGGKPPSMDGINQWPSFTGDVATKRKEIVYNIDAIEHNNINAAIRYGQYKLIVGNPGPGDWTPPPEKGQKNKAAFRKRVNRILSKKQKKYLNYRIERCNENEHCLRILYNILEKYITRKEKRKIQRKTQISEESHKRRQNGNRSPVKIRRDVEFQAEKHETNKIHFSEKATNLVIKEQLLSGKMRLFDLEKDPQEREDLAPTKTTLVRSLLKRLISHMDRYVPPDLPPDDEKANPQHWNGAWSPGWC